MISFNIHNLFKFTVDGSVNQTMEKRLNEEFGYFRTRTIESPDLTLKIVKKIPKAKIPIFPNYGFNGETFYYYIHGSPITLSYEFSSPLEIMVEDRVWIEDLMTDVIEALIFLKLLEKGYTFLHSSAISRKNEALLFCAFPHVGKTNIMLSFLLDNPTDYIFLSDEYTIISSEGVAYPYPRTIKIFDYNLDEFPELIDRFLYSSFKKQRLRIRHAFSKLTERLTSLNSNQKGFLGAYFFYAQELLRNIISTKIMITPKDLNWNVAHPSKIKKLFLFLGNNKQSKMSIHEIIDKDGLSTMLAANVLWEKELLNWHYFAYLFAFPHRRNPHVENRLNIQKEIIFNALQHVNCYKVEIPHGVSFRIISKQLQKYF